MRIAIVGGTGKEGQGLGMGWARAGQEVLVGSRVLERAQRVAEAINAAVGRGAATGMLNQDAAAAGEIVVLAVPYDAHAMTLQDIRESVRGKILVDVTVPLDPEKPRRLRIPLGGSATEEAQALLGPETRVVAAFQNISHTHLAHGETNACDILVCGDDADARQDVIKLAGLLGLRALDVGPARNARVVEGLTVLLMEINRRDKGRGAGIRITGLRPD
ncbi:MAG: NADPH-dependent F420 reductase [candidate division NC10 bacterium RIFCSPLOWO2_12_FULL_66_18]|nr:MAG: NADPH-dependent F420 reductase [candidate division NC10 bacterium RIFCSPLOWO2_12_FULL_66_18]